MARPNPSSSRTWTFEIDGHTFRGEHDQAKSVVCVALFDSATRAYSQPDCTPLGTWQPEALAEMRARFLLFKLEK